MTEEQVKQIVADMISSGELEVTVQVEKERFFNRDITKFELSIKHIKNGYSKLLLRNSTSLS